MAEDSPIGRCTDLSHFDRYPVTFSFQQSKHIAQKMTELVMALKAEVLTIAQELGLPIDESSAKLHESLFSKQGLFSCKWYKDHAAGKANDDELQALSIRQLVEATYEAIRVRCYDDTVWFAKHK
jgi:phage terminase Nu1 subunit (DNA packaging protein)